jgi:ATP-dependent DNA helicase RecG
MIGPDEPLRFLKGVGPRRAEQLARLGLSTVRDLLFHVPFRYLDRSSFTPPAKLRPGADVVVQGLVARVRSGRTAGRGVPELEVEIEDAGERAVLVWFGQPWRKKEFEPGRRVVASGRVVAGRRVRVDDVEVDDDAGAPGLLPLYATTEGLGRKVLRGLVREALEAAPAPADPLPAGLLVKRGLDLLADALRAAHAPSDLRDAERARRRLAYGELFVLQLRQALERRRRGEGPPGRPLPVSKSLDVRIRHRFPFAFTKAQERAVGEIRRDLSGGPPMNRLLQGDVGSGKTAVAVYALLAAVGNKAQAAFLAPTELLAEQHHRTLSRLLEGSRVRLELLSGGRSGRERSELLARIADGGVDLVVGTHAILEGDVRFRDLALAVIDEQQRFGVLQRARLREKGRRPHVLVTTATPIPRTLALTYYGDLDLTVLDERPPGRRPVTTLRVPPAGRRGKLQFVRRELDEGRQAYFVYPLVEESERLRLRAATRMRDELAEHFAPHRVALLHGRMTPEEKDAAMEEFRSGRARVLAATSVVEVGIDVPNATVMFIDHAERYGLSQLHQLRGRVGRGSFPSTCIAVGERSPRLDAFVSTDDGFRIAEADLKLRGPGDAAGFRQSGLPMLRSARLPDDAELLRQAREDAAALAAEDPGLERHPGLREALERGAADVALLEVG